MGDEARGRLARSKLGQKYEHLAAAERLVNEVERVAHALARGIDQRRNLRDLSFVRALDGVERDIALGRLLEHALRRKALQQIDDQALLANELPRGGARFYLSRQLAFAFGHARGKRLVDARTCEELRLRLAQQVAKRHNYALLIERLRAVRRQRIDHQAKKRNALVEGRCLRAIFNGRRRGAGKNRPHLIIGAILLKQRVVHGELVGNVVVAQELHEQIAVHRLSHLLIQRDDLRQILPTAGRHERFTAARPRFDLVEAVLLRLEERGHGRVKTRFGSIGLPRAVVRLDIDFAQTVKRHDVELVHRAVVLGRVARTHDDPSFRHLMFAERLELQELEHRGIQRLRNAVDLVEEQDALAQPRALHVIVNRRDDLRHRVLGCIEFLPLEFPMLDMGKAERALARMMCHGVRHDADAQLAGDLLHDGGLADSRRAHQENRSLVHGGNREQPRVIPLQICLNSVFHLLFR